MIFGETVEHVRRETYKSPIGQTLTRDVVLPPIRGCSLQAAETAEPADDISFKVTTQAVLYVPPGTDVRPLDKITARAVAYEVEGQPLGEISAYTGTQAMIPVQLRRVSQ